MSKNPLPEILTKFSSVRFSCVISAPLDSEPTNPQAILAERALKILNSGSRLEVLDFLDLFSPEPVPPPPASSPPWNSEDDGAPVTLSVPFKYSQRKHETPVAPKPTAPVNSTPPHGFRSHPHRGGEPPKLESFDQVAAETVANAQITSHSAVAAVAALFSAAFCKSVTRRFCFAFFSHSLPIGLLLSIHRRWSSLSNGGPFFGTCTEFRPQFSAWTLCFTNWQHSLPLLHNVYSFA